MRTSLLCAVLLIACSGDATDPSLITYARVIGVRVEAADDPERSTPRVDEAASAQVLVIGPHADVAVSYAMMLCPAAPANGGLPACAGEPLIATSPSGTTSTPQLNWPALDADAIGTMSDLLILGTVCESGTPVLDPNAVSRCEEPGSVGVSFANHVTLLSDSESNLNRHPSLDAALLTIDANPWDTGECSVTLPRDGKAHDITVTLVDSQREQVAGVNEEFLLSWFTTDGELSQHYSVLEVDDDDDRTLELTWTAPTPDAASSKSATTITLVLRDQRGGIDWLTRTICLTRS